LNTPLFIARRLGDRRQGKSFTGLIRGIAVLSIALGLAVMILAVAVVTGFQQEIRDKVIGFGAHIQVTHFDHQLAVDSRPLEEDPDFIHSLASLEGIRHVQSFATKAGIIRTEEAIHGVVMKGVGPAFDWGFFSKRLVEGTLPSVTDSIRSDEVLLSAGIARKLLLETGQDAVLYFIQDPPRIRRFRVAGLYETGLEELDEVMVLGDIRHIQRLNGWETDQVGGFEILVDDLRQLPGVHQAVLDRIPYHMDARTIRQMYPQIFDWLALLDMNVYVILLLMVVVAGINMITTLLIAVLEKTRLIGVLKSLGAANRMVRRVFLYHAAFLIGRGLLAGNLLGIGLGLLQQHLGIIRLDPQSYYVNQAPVNLEPLHLVLLNVGTFTICMLMLVVPSYIVTRISPVKAVEFK
jgi:lipoprotein-releasing system permease protein